MWNLRQFSLDTTVQKRLRPDDKQAAGVLEPLRERHFALGMRQGMHQTIRSWSDWPDHRESSINVSRI